MDIKLGIEVYAKGQKGIVSVNLTGQETSEEGIAFANKLITEKAQAILEEAIKIGEKNGYESKSYGGGSNYNNSYQKKSYSSSNGDEAPTAKQLAYLESLGYIGEAPKTKQECSKLIEEMKGGKFDKATPAPKPQPQKVNPFAQVETQEAPKEKNDFFSGFNGFGK